MAVNVNQILVGAHASLSVGAYSSTKGATTLTEVGATAGGVTIDPKTELYMVEIDQKLGKVAAIPKGREPEIKVKLLEATIENLRVALALPSTAVTGTAPNQTLNYDLSAGEQYYQIQLVGKGLGTNKTRTITIWRAFIKDVAPIKFAKDDVQGLDITLGICEDLASSTQPDSIRLVES